MRSKKFEIMEFNPSKVEKVLYHGTVITLPTTGDDWTSIATNEEGKVYVFDFLTNLVVSFEGLEWEAEGWACCVGSVVFEGDWQNSLEEIEDLERVI